MSMCRHDDDDDTHHVGEGTGIHPFIMHVMMHAHTYMAMMGLTYQPTTSPQVRIYFP